MHLYMLLSQRGLRTHTCARTLTVLRCGHIITLCHSNEPEEGAPPLPGTLDRVKAQLTSVKVR